MRMAHLVFLFVCISFPMYMIGLTSPLGNLIASQHLAGQPAGTPLDALGIIQILASNMANPYFAANVILLAVGTVLLGGFSAVFIIPALLFSAAINLIIIPSAAIMPGQCQGAGICLPPEIQGVLTVFLNLILILAIMEYIRGGG